MPSRELTEIHPVIVALGVVALIIVAFLANKALYDHFGKSSEIEELESRVIALEEICLTGIPPAVSM